MTCQIILSEQLAVKKLHITMENQHTHEFQKSIDGTDKKTRFQKSPWELQSESQTTEPYPFFGHGFTSERADYSQSAPLRQRAVVSVFCVSATDNSMQLVATSFTSLDEFQWHTSDGTISRTAMPRILTAVANGNWTRRGGQIVLWPLSFRS